MCPVLHLGQTALRYVHHHISIAKSVETLAPHEEPVGRLGQIFRVSVPGASRP